MNPCDKHEAQSIRESGAGFRCTLCEIERLRAVLEKADYLSAEVKEAWERERISIDTVNAAIAFDDAYSERGTTR